MDMNILSQYGLAAVLIGMAFKEMFSFLKSQKRSSRSEGILDKLAENAVRQTEILEQLREDHRDISRTIQSVDFKMDRITPRR